MGSGLRSVIASNSLINFTLALMRTVGSREESESSDYNLVSIDSMVKICMSGDVFCMSKSVF